MARLKKAEVIKRLNAIGVVFETNDYNELCELLKDQDTVGQISPPDEPVIIHLDNTVGGIDIPEAVYDRAKKIGFTDEQMATYTDHHSLYMACQRIKPEATTGAIEKPKITLPTRIRGELAAISFTCEISEARAAHVARVSYDEAHMNSFLRKQRINLRCVQKVTIERDYNAVRGILKTEMVIDYTKG